MRSLFVPGACGLALLPYMGLAVGPAPTADRAPPGFTWPSVVTGAILIAFILLCLTTMRARNGYRGVHEFVSGTRVVRPRAAMAGRRRRLPVVLPVATVGEPRRFGPFRVVGELGRSGESIVLAARATRLSRKAVASLVLALASLVFFCLTAIPALVLGGLALVDIQRDDDRRGRSLAVAGILLSLVCGFLSLIVWAFLLPALQMLLHR